MYSLSDLTQINDELVPLKEIADRELASIYGLSGPVYTPHLDAYMEVCIKKASMLQDLKKQGLLPISKTELISAELERLFKTSKTQAVVEYENKKYRRQFRPLKLNKSGKTVQKWARFWLLQTPAGEIDKQWQTEVKELWPQYFLIRSVGP